MHGTTFLIIGLALGAVAGLAGSFAWDDSVSEPMLAVSASAPDHRFCNLLDTMDRWACLIDAAGRGAFMDLPDGEAKYPYLTTLAALQTVQTVASSSRYNYFASTLDEFTPPTSTTQEICLDEGFGICGNQMLLFVDLMQRIGLEARTVQFYFEIGGRHDSHAAAEVFIDGSWRYVDITWGSVWLSDPDDFTTMLSLEQIESGEGLRAQSRIDPWFVSRLSVGYDPFDYIARKADIIRDGAGTVNLPWLRSEDRLIADFANVPNYVGDNTLDGTPNAITFGLTSSLVGEIDLSGSISGASACSKSELVAGDRRVSIAEGPFSMSSIDGGAQLRVEGTDDACYVVFSELAVTSTGS